MHHVTSPCYFATLLWIIGVVHVIHVLYVKFLDDPTCASKLSDSECSSLGQLQQARNANGKALFHFLFTINTNLNSSQLTLISFQNFQGSNGDTLIGLGRLCLVLKTNRIYSIPGGRKQS